MSSAFDWSGPSQIVKPSKPSKKTKPKAHQQLFGISRADKVLSNNRWSGSYSKAVASKGGE